MDSVCSCLQFTKGDHEPFYEFLIIIHSCTYESKICSMQMSKVKVSVDSLIHDHGQTVLLDLSQGSS